MEKNKQVSSHTPEETRVYIINADDAFDFHKASDEAIISYCERTGQIYSLDFFEEQINNEEVNLSNSFIRIIDAAPILKAENEKLKAYADYVKEKSIHGAWPSYYEDWLADGEPDE